MARRAHPSRPGRGSPPKRVLLGTFRGGTLASAPQPWPPPLLRRPARGRHGSEGAHSLAARRPFPSPSRACGPGPRDVLEPQASAAFPGRADVNSFVAGGKEAFLPPPSLPGRPSCWVGSRGGWQEARKESRNVGPSPYPSSADLGPRAGASGLLRAEGGICSPDHIAGLGTGRPLPRAPGAQEGARRRRPGREEATSARGARRLRGARPDLQ